MRLLLYIVAMCSALLVGCTTDEHTAALIRHAEDIAADHPDSALSILYPINNRTIGSKELRARHSLALSYTLDKCYIDVDKDTLIRVAYEYYDTRRDTRAAMMSNYLMGKVYLNACEYSSSLLYFLSAEQYAKQESDNLYLGLIYRYVSYLYGRVYSNKEALVYGEKSLECFNAYGDKLYIDWAIVDLGRLYHNAKDYNRSISIYNDFLTREDYSDSPSLYAEVFRSLASTYFAVDSVSHCVALYQRASALDSTVMQSNDYAMLGLAYAKIGEIAKAENLMRKVKNDGEKQFLQYRIHKYNNDCNEALNALEEALELQNEVVRTISTQDISSIGVEYFRYRDALKTQQLKVSYLTVGIVCVFFCSVILLISIIIRYRHRLLKRELDENMALVAGLRVKIVDNEDLLLNKQLLIEQLFSSHFEAFNRLSDAYYGCKGLSNEKFKIYNEFMSILSDVASNQNTIIKMEEFINRYKDGLMVKFNQSFPHYSRLDINLFMYIVLGFSARAISIFLNEKIDVVYNRKSRLKQKIQKSDVLNKECFLELMR